MQLQAQFSPPHHGSGPPDDHCRESPTAVRTASIYSWDQPQSCSTIAALGAQPSQASQPVQQDAARWALPLTMTMTTSAILLLVAALVSRCQDGCMVGAQGLPPSPPLVPPSPSVLANGTQPVVGAPAPSPIPAGAQFSELWGQNGEKFDPAGRLLDYSYAGYMAGEAPLPDLVPTHNVRDFGAKGDGKTDDSNAFLAALKAIVDAGGTGVLGVPAGRYVLTQPLTITTRISIKGAGSATSILLITRSLEQVENPGSDDPQAEPGNPFSYRGGFIQYDPRQTFVSEKLLTSITAAAKKGDNTIKVASTAGITVGEWIVVTQGSPTDNDWSPMNQGLSGGCGDPGFCTSEFAFAMPTRVAEVVDGTTLVLERPLTWELYPTFSPHRVWKWAPQISNVGVEGLGFMFYSGQYQGHITEVGWNAIEFKYMANSWIRDVQWLNADLGLNILRSNFITVTAVRGLATAARAHPGDNTTGHHGVIFNWCVDCYLHYFDMATLFYHDIQTNKFSTGCVVSYGRGTSLAMDHHRAQQYGTLWTQINAGDGARGFKSGGSSNRGTYAGPFTTFWNIYTDSNQGLGRLFNDFGPAINFVAIPPATEFPEVSQFTKTWTVEGIPPNGIYPLNLHTAMWQLRMSSPNLVSPQLGGKGNGGKKLDAY